MRAWEPVEISINRIDVDDIITTSFGSMDTPPVGGEGLLGGSDSNDKMGGIRDNWSQNKILTSQATKSLGSFFFCVHNWLVVIDKSRARVLKYIDK